MTPTKVEGETAGHHGQILLFQFNPIPSSFAQVTVKLEINSEFTISATKATLETNSKGGSDR